MFARKHLAVVKHGANVYLIVPKQQRYEGQAFDDARPKV
jgi:hypothetical protein